MSVSNTDEKDPSTSRGTPVGPKDTGCQAHRHTAAESAAGLNAVTRVKSHLEALSDTNISIYFHDDLDEYLEKRGAKLLSFFNHDPIETGFTTFQHYLGDSRLPRQDLEQKISSLRSYCAEIA